MIDLVEEFKDELSQGSHLIVMPLSRVLIGMSFELGNIDFIQRVKLMLSC